MRRFLVKKNVILVVFSSSKFGMVILKTRSHNLLHISSFFNLEVVQCIKVCGHYLHSILLVTQSYIFCHMVSLHKESELHSNFSITGLGMSDALCVEEKCDGLFFFVFFCFF